MTPYRAPGWVRKTLEEIAAADDETRLAWYNEARAIDAENVRVAQAAQERWNAASVVILDQCPDMAGPLRRARKHLWNPTRYEFVWRERERSLIQLAAKRLELAVEKDRARALSEKAQRAVLWLAAHDRQPGSYVDAIETANCISAEEEIDRLRKSTTLHQFHGCECDGWDGESRRCECGNRRVGWNSEQNDFEAPHVYAEPW